MKRFIKRTKSWLLMENEKHLYFIFLPLAFSLPAWLLIEVFTNGNGIGGAFFCWGIAALYTYLYFEEV